MDSLSDDERLEIIFSLAATRLVDAARFGMADKRTNVLARPIVDAAIDADRASWAHLASVMRPTGGGRARIEAELAAKRVMTSFDFGENTLERTWREFLDSEEEDDFEDNINDINNMSLDSFYSISARGLRALSNIVATSKILTILDLGTSYLGMDGGVAIANAVGSSTSLQGLTLYGYGLTEDEGEPALVDALASNQNLTRLTLYGANAEEHGGDRNTHTMVRLVREAGKLTVLDLDYCYVGTDAAVEIAAFLEGRSILTKTTLPLMCRRSLPAAGLGLAFRSAASLTNLCLAGNNFGDEGAIALASALEKNTTIRVLILAHSLFFEEGWGAIAHMLSCNNTLLELNLFGASIDDESDDSSLALAEAFRVNTSLKKIDLRYSIEAEAGLLALCAALRENTVLEYVDLRDVFEKQSELVRDALAGRQGVLLGKSRVR